MWPQSRAGRCTSWKKQSASSHQLCSRSMRSRSRQRARFAWDYRSLLAARKWARLQQAEEVAVWSWMRIRHRKRQSKSELLKESIFRTGLTFLALPVSTHILPRVLAGKEIRSSQFGACVATQLAQAFGDLQRNAKIKPVRKIDS